MIQLGLLGLVLWTSVRRRAPLSYVPLAQMHTFYIFRSLATNLVMYITNVMGGDPATAAIQVSPTSARARFVPLTYASARRWQTHDTGGGVCLPCSLHMHLDAPTSPVLGAGT